jgi:hypothetical protein
MNLHTRTPQQLAAMTIDKLATLAIGKTTPKNAEPVRANRPQRGQNL